MNETRLDNNQKAQLAHDFNQFYLKITSQNIDQVGCYKVLEEIGEGSFGKVYLATHMLLNIPVVLKAGLIDDPNIVREIYYHKQLKHKNIVKLYEVIKTESHLWLVMEYCQGNELYYYIYENRRIEFKQCQNLFFQIILAIKYVHSLNLVHRDLKLENILLADRKKTVIKLTDFGFVREFNPAKRNFLQTICGTTVYMAPEVLKNEKYNGFATDIWSLGVILYTMLYGQMPFDEDDDLKTKYKIIHEEPMYNDVIGSSANSIIKKMLLKNPYLRPNLNEILNSDFLIDITNKFPDRRASNHGDCESIMSINQHFNSGLPPFQSRFVKGLLKNLQRADIKIDKLKEDVMNNEMNSLTAFYELALTKEFLKKRKKYNKNKRRKAKKSLSRSKRKVKSVLSISDDGSQPLERIMSTLSMNSRKEHNSTPSQVTHALSSLYPEPGASSLSQSRTSLALSRRSLDQRSLRGAPGGGSFSINNSNDTHIFQSKNSIPPATRTVSFFTNEAEKTSSINSALNSMSDKRKRNSKLMSKLQFWKKRDDTHDGTFNNNGYKPQWNNNNDTSSSLITGNSPSSHEKHNNNNTNSSNETKDQFSDLTLNSPSPKTVQEDDHYNNTLDGSMMNSKPGSNAMNLNQNIVNAKGNKNSSDDKEKEKNIKQMNNSQLIDNNLSPVIDSPDVTGSPLNSIRPNDLIRTRTRPSSMISQMSQVSHLSQLSTMMSESELEMLGSDSMDDFEEEEMYESSSLNTSTNDFINSNRVSSSTPSRVSSANKRPSYRRQVSSDVSIASASTTTTTTRHGSGTHTSSQIQGLQQLNGTLHQKKSSLSQVSSNSSDESSDVLSPINSTILRHPPAKLRGFSRSPTNVTSNSPDGQGNHSPIPGSPVGQQETESHSHHHNKLEQPVPLAATSNNDHNSNSNLNSCHIFQASIPRSSSPPMPSKFKNLNKNKPSPITIQTHERPNELPTMYQPKFIINEENEEDSL